MTTFKTASLGTVSHATLRTEDLLDAFASELEYHVNRNAEAWSSDEGRVERDRLLKLVSEAQDMDDYDSDEASELVNELQDELNAFAPPYCYFGNTEGDGSDFGFWPSMEQIEELPHITDDAQDDDGEPIGFEEQARNLGEDCKFVNDHGNVTVYGADGSVLIELV